MKTYQWGIIGPGKIARKFTAALGMTARTKLAAVASRDGERAAAFAREFGALRHYNSYAALAADPDIDAIYISSPHAFHAAQAVLCLDQGKPVLCEKPMALNAVEVNSMIAAARRNQTFLMEAMWSRFLPHITEVLDAVAAGRIGPVKSVRADFGFKGPYDPGNRLFDPALGGGSVLDIGVYNLFLLLALLGKPDSIHASAVLAPTGVDESAQAIFKYDNGAIASMSCTFACQTGLTAEIAGTEGFIRIPSPWYRTHVWELVQKDWETERHELAPVVNGFEYQILEVTRCLDGNKKESPLMPHAFSLLLAETMDEVLRQSGVRGTVTGQPA